MNFRKSRLRHIERSLESRGIRGTLDVEITYLTFEAPPPRAKAKALDAKPTKRKSCAKVTTPEPEKRRQEVLHIWYDDEDHPIYPSDPIYEIVKNASPGDRPRIIGRKNPRMGKLNYPQNTLA